MNLSLWFDLTIVLVLAGVPLYLVWFRYRWVRIMARGPHVFLVLLLSLIWRVMVYGSLVEPHRLVVRHQSIIIGPGDSRLSLVLVSDSHLGLYRHADWLQKVINRINSLEPDVVVVLGDIVDGEHGLRELVPLNKIESQLGTFAVLGNTDYRVGAIDVRRAVESQSVEVLTNEWVRLGENGPVLAGLDDIWYGTPDWETTFQRIPSGVPVILAVHNPDPADRAEYNGVDLMISGHTHGGQVRLPFIGPSVPLPTTLGQQYDQGFFPYGKMSLFITSGVGESTVRARLFNPPEIVQLEVVY